MTEIVGRPLQAHQWRDATFLHWRFPPDVVARLLPRGLTPELYDGSAWVSLVVLRMRGPSPKHERCGHCRAAEDRDEIPAPHSQPPPLECTQEL